MFERPDLLWLLVAAPLLALPGILAIRRGRRLAGALEASIRSLAYGALIILLAGLEFPVHMSARRMTVVAVMDESRSIAPDQLAWMRARVASLARAMNPKDRIAVVGFGSDARLLAPLSDPRLLGVLKAPVNGGATNLEGALTTALGVFPEDTEKRLVLLSDGDQTEGDALSEAPALAADGVRVFTASPPPSRLQRVALTALKVPPAVRAYQRFAVRINIENEARAAVDGRLTLSDNGRLAGEQSVTLRPGLNQFELPYRIDHPGANEMSVALDVARPVTAVNAKADAAVSVLDTPHILIVSSDALKSLTDALKLHHYKVDEAAPGALSNNPDAYLSYQAIILGDISASSLSPDVQKALGHYVADLGGGLIATGGTMLDGKFKGSELEKILPVTFRPQPPPPTREPVAVYLLIDRSNSMSYDSRDPEVRDFQRIRYAKRAAVALLNQLDDTDFAGVIAFDSQPYVLSHLRPVGEDRAELVDRIERLQPGGGTDFKEALEIAEREILQSGLAVRQVILLTDGDTNREYHDHDQLIADYAREGIPVSTIRIGPDLANLRLLKDFAMATGGTFYRVRDIERLPQLLVNLTRHAASRSPRDRVITAGDPSSILNGISIKDTPPIDFVATTKLKNGAGLPLKVRQGGKVTPLLATWQYGLGRASVFTADPDALTTLSWIRWDHYAQFWSQLVNWSMRQGDSGVFDLHIHNARDGVWFEALKADDKPVAGLYCRISGGSIVVDFPLSQVGPSLYRGDAGMLPPDKYTATLMLKANDVEQVLAQRPFIVSAVPAEQAELKLRPPDTGLLSQLAASTGGAMGVSPNEVLKRHGATIVVYRSAEPYVLPIAIILLLAAVFIRRRMISG